MVMVHLSSVSHVHGVKLCVLITFRLIGEVYEHNLACPLVHLAPSLVYSSVILVCRKWLIVILDTVLAVSCCPVANRSTRFPVTAARMFLGR